MIAQNTMIKRLSYKEESDPLLMPVVGAGGRGSKMYAIPLPSLEQTHFQEDRHLHIAIHHPPGVV